MGTQKLTLAKDRPCLQIWLFFLQAHVVLVHIFFIIFAKKIEEDPKLATKDEPIKKQTKLLPFDIEISPGEDGEFEPIGRENKSIAFVHFKFTRQYEGRKKLITEYWLLHSYWTICNFIFDFFSDQTRNCTRKNGNVGDSLLDLH